MIPDFSIIVVHYLDEEGLAGCLKSVRRAQTAASCEVLVVDNGSDRVRWRQIESGFSEARILASGGNAGFSQAANRAMSEARAPLLVLLDQRAQLAPAALSELKKFFAQAPDEVGIVGGRLLDARGKPLASAGPFPNLASYLCRLALPAPLRLCYLWNGRGRGARRVDWSAKAFLAIRREAYARVGPLDESFLMHYQDLDWCRRARRCGWSTVSFPGAQASLPGGVNRRPTQWLEMESCLSLLRYFHKHRGAWEYHLLHRLTQIFFAYRGWRFPHCRF
ncbi:MAG: glycosyltransferase [Elusimicrobia bacterium]|nr:glycosyltransferase [Elusimicrobiota bacterium]